MDGFCNEESSLCLLPKSFKSYHIQLAEENEEDDNDITKNIPGMPPTNNSSKKETNDKTSEQTKVIEQKDIDKALDTLKNAKLQYTWKSDKEPFFKQ